MLIYFQQYLKITINVLKFKLLQKLGDTLVYLDLLLCTETESFFYNSCSHRFAGKTDCLSPHLS